MIVSSSGALIQHANISEGVRTQITAKVEELCLREADCAIEWNLRWKRCGNWCNNVAKLTSSFSLICDFVAGVYDRKEFVFVAGCSNTCSLVLMSYANYCFLQAKEKVHELDALAAIPVPRTT